MIYPIQNRMKRVIGKVMVKKSPMLFNYYIQPVKVQSRPKVLASILKLAWNKDANIKKLGITQATLCHPSLSHFASPAAETSAATICRSAKGILNDPNKRFSTIANPTATAIARMKGLVCFLKVKNSNRTTENFNTSSIKLPKNIPFIDLSITNAFPTMSAPKKSANAMMVKFFKLIELSYFIFYLWHGCIKASLCPSMLTFFRLSKFGDFFAAQPLLRYRDRFSPKWLSRMFSTPENFKQGRSDSLSPALGTASRSVYKVLAIMGFRQGDARFAAVPDSSQKPKGEIYSPICKLLYTSPFVQMGVPQYYQIAI